MSEEKGTLDELMAYLRQQRDELQLQMHLAEMDAKDEYERLSDNFEQLTAQYQPVKDAVSESTENVVAALTLAAEEMKNGFFRVAKSIKGE